MMPLFANPTAAWFLLGIPVVLAIHFLQQRSRLVRTTGWFLIERLAPDSRRGRTWDHLRHSSQLWMQLAVVALVTWVLVQPRWTRAESAQTVAIVLDASISMQPFREAAGASVRSEMAAAAVLATRTTWLVMTTDVRSPTLYRGASRAEAEAALARWQPLLGSHESEPILRLARGLVGAAGYTFFVTNERGRTVPGQTTAGVGRPIGNVGFAGSSATADGEGTTWRALVRYFSDQPQRRTWQVQTGTGVSAAREIEIQAGAMIEISGSLPAADERFTVLLSADEFVADDRLPLVRPKPKPLGVQVDGDDAAAEFFRRVASDIAGVQIRDYGELRLARLDAAAMEAERRGGIFWPPASDGARLDPNVVTPERSPLVNGLNWQGWIGPTPGGFAPVAGDTPLLWQGSAQLAFVHPAPTGGRKLLLAFDWETSTAGRSPSLMLLVRRFLEDERDRQARPYAANFDSGQLIPLRGFAFTAEQPLALRFHPADGAPEEVVPVDLLAALTLRAPERAGLFEVELGGSAIVTGSAQFADSRQSDFRAAETFASGDDSERSAAIVRNTVPDPLVPLWLLALVGLLAATWWERQSRLAAEAGAVREAGA